MQNNFEPLNLKNANRHLAWLVDKIGDSNKARSINISKKIKVSLWNKILNILAKVF